MFAVEDINEIVEGLYMSDGMTSTNLDVLQRLKITHILTVANYLPPKFKDKFTYLVVEVVDDPNENLKPHFKKCIKFIDNARESGG